ncbi:efflux RND transporter periplasmic adaptor subunit [Desulforhopalus sp. IMCC35007]|uniref:efflux RND transporter periplasmic adaptor subunit n=1 Tax=Desulforhopalus sp. IMCC35007 TaxID=2569543 RepID=UPI0010ADED0C|nr:efflux RND transporter periplasmic adaptor subunit [Desulforhopalus sp. IMCC35007]TKB09668.1 efflux RND transporter periplasmic adaptor subunit [Desulforhopalus sp. IMCC35007]
MKRRIIQWSTLAVAIIILISIISYTRQLIAQQVGNPHPQRINKPQLPEVAVITVERAGYNARIRGYGETEPHFTLTLTAQVSGQVVAQSEKLEAGYQVKKGEVLIELEDSAYQSAVADAKSTLASARLDLLEEQREASQAKAEWLASGISGEPDSELVLHKPQLEAADAVVSKAEAALLSAEKDLSRTKLTAPFDAIVVERMTAPGSYLQAGTEVATLYSTDMVEIPVALTTRDWENLPDPATLSGDQWPVVLKSVEGNQTWAGHVLRAEQHVDTTSRQRTLLIAVDSPLAQVPPLFPGTFVETWINGQRVDNTWELPSSALSQSGEIWYISQDDTLAKFSSEPIFSSGNSIYIKVPEELAKAPIQIVVHPLSSYLPGMRVQPVVENDNA